MSRLHEKYGITIKQLEHKNSELDAEFENYRKLNNLDRYFTLNLDEESRERVLNNVKELMTTTDWHYVDRTSVLAMESANPQSYLNQILINNDDF